jgi:outer membrane protein insertion porin family
VPRNIQARFRGFVNGVLQTVLVLVCVASASGYEDTIEVKDLSFSGLDAFTSGQIKGILATRQSGWLPWSRKHYFDRAEFDADLARIHAFYVDHGYPAQRVSGVTVDVSPDRKSVQVTIAIDEGKPVIVQEVRARGIRGTRRIGSRTVRDVPLVAGAPRDRDRVRASRDLAVRLLKDNGYPFGYVDAAERPGDAAGQLIVTFRGDPGPVMRFGDVRIDGLERVDAGLVRRHLAFAPGDMPGESRAENAAASFVLQAFELASVTSRLDEADGDRIPMRITVAEGPRRLKFGFGTAPKNADEERSSGST